MKWLQNIRYTRAVKALHTKLILLVRGPSRYFAQEVKKQMSDEKANLKNGDIATILASTISAMSENPQYYYHSVVDDRYSKLTPDGRDAVIALVEMLMPKIRYANKAVIDEKVKNHVWDTLKK